MPELNFNALATQEPQGVLQGFMQGQQLRNQLAQQEQQRQLGELQLQNALREQRLAGEEEAAYKAAGNDYARLQSELMQRGLGKQALAVGAQQAKLRADQIKMHKDTVELTKTAAQQVMANPQNAAQILSSFGQRYGIDMADDLAQIQQLGGNPDAIRQWAAGVAVQADKLLPKFQEFSTPGGGKQIGTVNPVTGGFTAMSTMAPQLTPYESARLDQENQRLAQEATGVVYQEDANGNIVALPSKLKKGEVPTARVAVAPGGGLQPLAAKPSEAVGKEQMSINQQKAIIKGALDAVAATPDAFGWTTGNLPEAIRARTATPAENEARSYLFNVVSGVIKERAGTAQSAAEAETLRRFLPVETDNADIIKDKMTAFDKYLTAKEAGTTKKRPAAEAPKYPGAPSVGTVQQGYRYKGGDPANPSSWEKQ